MWLETLAKHRLPVLFFSGLLLFTVQGCTAPDLDYYTQSSNLQINQNSLDEGSLEDENHVVLAIIGDKLITLADIERQLNRLSPLGTQRLDYPAGRVELANAFIQSSILAHEAELRGYANDPTIAYRTDEAVAEEVLSRLIANDSTGAENSIDRDRVLEEHRVILNRPDQIRAYINVLEEEPTDPSWQSVLETSQTLNRQDRLLHFREWTLQSSVEDSSKARAGDLGFIDIETLTLLGVPEPETIFEETIQGNLLGPYNCNMGVFYLYLHEMRSAVTTGEESLQEQVDAFIERALYEEMRAQLSMALRENAEITINNNLLASLDSSTRTPLQEDHPFDSLSHLSPIELHHRLTPTYDLSFLIEQLQSPEHLDTSEINLE